MSDRRFEPSQPKSTKITPGRRFSEPPFGAPFYMPPALWHFRALLRLRFAFLASLVLLACLFSACVPGENHTGGPKVLAI